MNMYSVVVSGLVCYIFTEVFSYYQNHLVLKQMNYITAKQLDIIQFPNLKNTTCL